MRSMALCVPLVGRERPGRHENRASARAPSALVAARQSPGRRSLCHLVSPRLRDIHCLSGSSLRNAAYAPDTVAHWGRTFGTTSPCTILLDGTFEEGGRKG